MALLRQFTENPDTEVVFSIAGGRKTMSALGALCMTLLGRECDSLCHVLVDPPFDNPTLRPKFYYPDPDVGHHVLPDGTRVSSTSAHIRLCSIPFVRTRNLFLSERNRLPGTFTRLVADANRAVEETAPLAISLDPNECTLAVGSQKLSLSPSVFAMLWFLAERRKKSLPDLCGMAQLACAFEEFCGTIDLDRMPECMHHQCFKNWHDSENCSKLVSLTRKAVVAANLPASETALLHPTRKRGVYGLGLGSAQIAIL